MHEAFAAYAARSAADAKHFKPLETNARIFPNDWAPIITWHDGKRVVSPMRYRVHPHWSHDELPSKYNLFNARLDALRTRRTWKPLLQKNHGLLVFERFFEWVVDRQTGKKNLVSFGPLGRDVMWCPVLFDHWVAPVLSESITSFAVITGDPPAEVLAAGHDRCPIFLRRDVMDSWLNPVGQSVDQTLKLLHIQEVATLEHEPVVAA